MKNDNWKMENGCSKNSSVTGYFMLGSHCPCETLPGAIGEGPASCPGGGGAGTFSDDETALISEAVCPSFSAR